MHRQIPCPPGQWTRIIANRFMAMPKTFHIEFASAGGGPVSGRYRETYTNWVFPGSVMTGSLSPVMEFNRRWLNTFYYIDVKPEEELTALVR